VNVSDIMCILVDKSSNCVIDKTYKRCGNVIAINGTPLPPLNVKSLISLISSSAIESVTTDASNVSEEDKVKTNNSIEVWFADVPDGPLGIRLSTSTFGSYHNIEEPSQLFQTKNKGEAEFMESVSNARGLVVTTTTGGPASLLLRPGDMVCSVNGIGLSTLIQEEAVELLKSSKSRRLIILRIVLISSAWNWDGSPDKDKENVDAAKGVEEVLKDEWRAIKKRFVTRRDNQLDRLVTRIADGDDGVDGLHSRKMTKMPETNRRLVTDRQDNAGSSLGAIARRTTLRIQKRSFSKIGNLTQILND